MPVDYSIKVAEKALEACMKPSQRALELARMSLLDTVAVAAAAPHMSPSARAFAGELARGPGGGSVILGLWRRAPPLEAGAANAFLAHALELDDWLAPAYVHVGSVVVPAIISASLESRLQDVLKAIVAGYEVAYWVGAYLGRSHYDEWHTTATAGATAAAAAFLLVEKACDVGVEDLASAIEASSAYMGGSWALPRGAPALKPLSPANAVVTGILASRAASRLVVGGPVGGILGAVCRLLRGECSEPPSLQGFAIEYNGFKFYPTCRHTHTAIEAAERLAGRIDDPGRIREVEVRVYKEAAVVAGHSKPGTVEEARFSIRYLVALALTRGRVGMDSLVEGLSDKKVHELLDKVRILVSSEYTEAYPEKQPATVRVYLDNGEVIEETVEYPRGDPARGVSLQELLEKASILSSASGDPRVLKIAKRIAGAALDVTLSNLVEPLIS